MRPDQAFRTDEAELVAGGDADAFARVLEAEGVRAVSYRDLAAEP